MKIKGKIHKFGDNVNTDEIIPARYLNMSTAEELAPYCMEDASPSGFAKRKKQEAFHAPAFFPEDFPVRFKLTSGSVVSVVLKVFLFAVYLEQ